MMRIKQLGQALKRFLERSFHTSPQRALEFLMAAVILVSAAPTRFSLLIGSLISLMGIFLRIWLAGYKRSEKPLNLHSPYRFVRQPYFLSTCLLFLGLAFAGRQGYVLALTMALLMNLYKFYGEASEGLLAQQLGPYFRRYRDEVPALLPRLWPVRFDENFSFISDGYSLLAGCHRELESILKTTIAFGLLYLCQLLTARELFRIGMMAVVVLYLIGCFIYYGVVKRGGRPKPIGI